MISRSFNRECCIFDRIICFLHIILVIGINGFVLFIDSLFFGSSHIADYIKMRQNSDAIKHSQEDVLHIVPLKDTKLDSALLTDSTPGESVLHDKCE